LAVKLAVKKPEKIRENYLTSKVILLKISVFFLGVVFVRWGINLRFFTSEPQKYP